MDPVDRPAGAMGYRGDEQAAWIVCARCSAMVQRGGDDTIRHADWHDSLDAAVDALASAQLHYLNRLEESENKPHKTARSAHESPS